MKHMSGTTTRPVLRLMIAAGVAIAVMGLPPVASPTLAEEPQVQEQSQTEPGEVTERAVDTRDYRSQPAPQQTEPNGPLASVFISGFETVPEHFKPGEPLTNLVVWMSCRGTISSCDRVTEVKIEVWHTRPNGQPVLVSLINGATPFPKPSRGAWVVALPGTSVAAAEGTFTVKITKGTAFLSRTFAIVPYQLTIQKPPTVDHRTR